MKTPAAATTPFSATSHVFVDSELREPHVAEADRHHLTRVLRLRPGAAVTACDGRGGWLPCRLDAEGGLEPDGEVVREAAPSPPITVAFALTKGERPDLTVRGLTELGADRIVPFVAERSVVRWDKAKAARHLQRFEELARQAAMQSRRVHLPSIGLMEAPDASLGHGPSREAIPTFEEVASALGANATMADMAGHPPGITRPAVMIGPEGGWSPSERAAALPRVRLGTQVLRAETAALTAGALLVAIRSDIVSKIVPSRQDF